MIYSDKVSGFLTNISTEFVGNILELGDRSFGAFFLGLKGFFSRTGRRRCFGDLSLRGVDSFAERCLRFSAGAPHLDRNCVGCRSDDYQRDERVKDDLALALELLSKVLKMRAYLLLKGIVVFLLFL